MKKSTFFLIAGSILRHSMKMKKPQKIFLVGMMGSGKSYWSSKLGWLLSLPSFDLDNLIEAKEGTSVREIFETRGEAYFREMERDTLQTGVAAEAFILATGGGTPCFYDNMDFMKREGLTIWLKPSVEEIIMRIKKSPGTRPVLAQAKTDADLKAHLSQLLMQRTAWYAQADIIMDKDHFGLRDLEEQIKAFV